MALSWTSSLQDLVALTVVQKSYTDLRTHEKNFLDGAASPPTSSPGGVAGQALNVVGQYAQWFAQAGATAAQSPAAWEHLLVAETALRFATGIKPSDLAIHRANAQAAWQAAVESYSVADASDTTLNDSSINVQMIRFHVIRHCLRRGRGKRMFIPVPDIDNAIRWAMDYIWYFGGWNFRTRHCTITIPVNTMTVTGSSGGKFTLAYNGNTAGLLDYNATASEIQTQLDGIAGSGAITISGTGGVFTLTFDPSATGRLSASTSGICAVTFTQSNNPTFNLAVGETFHSFVSQGIVMNRPSATAGRMIKTVSSQEFNEIKASPFIWSTSATTASPRYFFIEHRSDGTKYWNFWPAPDQEYEGYCTIAIAAPSYPASITATTAFDYFPAPMRRLIPDFVLAKLMRQYGVEGWETVEANAKEQLVKIAPEYDTHGASDLADGVGVVDVYHDGYLRNRGL